MIDLPPGMPAWLLWSGPLFILVMIGAVGFFAGVETGLFSISSARVRRLAGRGERRAQIIEKLLEKPEYFIGTALVGINLAHVSLAVVSSYYVSFWIDRPNVAALANTVLVTPLVLFFGEVLPKSVFRLRPNTMTLIFARPFLWAYRLLKPVTVIVVALAHRILPGTLGHEFDSQRHREEILGLVRAGEETGVVEDDEKQMIESVLELSDITVREVMVPRVAMAAFPVSANYRDLLERTASEAYTRYPMYDGTPDRIVGVLHVADLLDPRGVDPSRLRSPIFIPESAKVDDALEQLRSAGRHMAIVVDEYGGTAGLVTIEDLLEELVGEIDDEHDDSHAPVVRLGDDAWTADARADLGELEELTGIRLRGDSEDIETIGGYVLERLGRIPSPGETLAVDDLLIRVTAADERRVLRLELTRVPGASGSHFGGDPDSSAAGA